MELLVIVLGLAFLLLVILRFGMYRYDKLDYGTKVIEMLFHPAHEATKVLGTKAITTELHETYTNNFNKIMDDQANKSDIFVNRSLLFRLVDSFYFGIGLDPAKRLPFYDEIKDWKNWEVKGNYDLDD